MLVIDVETSGLDINKNSLISIGAVDFDNPDRQFYEECRVWDGAFVSEESLDVNGFTEDQVRDINKKTLKEMMYSFKNWVDSSSNVTLAGQNPSFDRDFLNNSFWRADIDFKFAARNIDLHSVAYYNYIKNGITIPHKNGHSDLSLDKIAKYTGLTEEPKPHNALTGAKYEAEAFSRIMYGRKLLPEFESYKIPKHLET